MKNGQMIWKTIYEGCNDMIRYGISHCCNITVHSMSLTGSHTRIDNTQYRTPHHHHTYKKYPVWVKKEKKKKEKSLLHVQGVV